MKVAVIGNSHIACIKQAWDEATTQYPEVTLCFFGSNANTMESVTARDGVLLPGSEHVARSWEITSGGEKVVVLSDYDHVIVHGIVPFMTWWGRLHRWFLNNGRVSSGFRRATFRSGHPLTERVLDALDQLEHANVLLTPRPSPAVQSQDAEPVKDTDFGALSDFIENGFKDLGYAFLPQPAETVTRSFNTYSRYNEGAIGLGRDPRKSRQAPAGDRNHMNLAYGEVWLKQVISALKARSA